LLQAKNPCDNEQSFTDWRILRRIGAVGLLWNRNSTALLGIQMSTAQRNESFERMESDERIHPVHVEGIRFPMYILSEDMELLDAVVRKETDERERTEFLAPLDPMLWDRKLIEAVWDYPYSWEIYTPAAKRKYGYYVLPVLNGSKLIGRIEMTADRKENILNVKNIWYEPGVRPTKKLLRSLDAAVARMAKFNECGIISGKTEAGIV